MRSHNQSGTVVTMVAIVGLGLALVAALGFGFWAFGQSKDYKDNYQQKSSADVSAALTAQKAELQKQFNEQVKSPVKTFKGSATYGNITFDYPKTWSAYVDETGSSTPIDGYFHPNQVPSTRSNTAFALRLELIAKPYAGSLTQFSAQLKKGTLTATAFVPKQLALLTNLQPGTRLDGQITNDFTGSMVIIQVRDKTLQIYTESNDYLDDFNNIVLPSLSFAP